jgi:hypothetical protein
MVRTYKQRNPFCRNCKLSGEQFLAVLDSYLRFESALGASKLLGLPRQTVGAHYVKIGKYLADSPLNREQQPPFVGLQAIDPDAQAWWRTRDPTLKEKYMNRLWNECYDLFSHGVPREKYAKLRAQDLEPVDKHVWWIVCRELWSKWGRVPRSTFRYHFALVLLTTMAREDAAGVSRDYDPALLMKPEIVQKAVTLLHILITDWLRQRPL